MLGEDKDRSQELLPSFFQVSHINGRAQVPAGTLPGARTGYQLQSLALFAMLQCLHNATLFKFIINFYFLCLKWELGGGESLGLAFAIYHGSDGRAARHAPTPIWVLSN